jgi:hypothetical protein
MPFFSPVAVLVFVSVLLPVAVEVSPVPEAVGLVVWQEVNNMVTASIDVNDSFTSFIVSACVIF